MKKNKTLFTIFVAITLVFLFSITAYANSSWHWISSSRPLDLFPVVVIVTLLLEIISVNYIAKVKDLKRVIPVVSLANLASFVVPYIWLGVSPRNVYTGLDDNIINVIKYTVEHTPTFTVSISFLLITLLVETPIVYLFFKDRVQSKKNLISNIILINIITTAITFAVERIFCYGEW